LKRLKVVSINRIKRKLTTKLNIHEISIMSRPNVGNDCTGMNVSILDNLSIDTAIKFISSSLFDVLFTSLLHVLSLQSYST